MAFPPHHRAEISAGARVSARQEIQRCRRASGPARKRTTGTPWRLSGIVANLAGRCAAIRPRHLDAAIAEELRCVAATLELQGCIVWQLAGQEQSLKATHEGLVHSEPSAVSKQVNREQCPWSHARLMSGAPVCFASLNELPTEAGRDAEFFAASGLQSALIMPLASAGSVFGALSLTTSRAERQWTKGVVVEVRLLAHVLSMALDRQQAARREEQLRMEVTRMQRLSVLGELAPAIAHELLKPVDAIVHNAEAALLHLASDTVDKADLRAILEDVERQGTRAGAIIHSLRRSMGTSKPPSERCCLNDLVREAVAFVRADFQHAQVRLRVSLAPDLPEVLATRVELQQVLVNLLVNAVQALNLTPSARRLVEVETTQDAHRVVVVVRDHGDGIAPGLLSKIFESMFSTKRDGLGMGLAISRRIIESHAGSIDATNHVDGGAIVRCTLPAAVGASSG